MQYYLSGKYRYMYRQYFYLLRKNCRLQWGLPVLRLYFSQAGELHKSLPVSAPGVAVDKKRLIFLFYNRVVVSQDIFVVTVLFLYIPGNALLQPFFHGGNFLIYKKYESLVTYIQAAEIKFPGRVKESCEKIFDFTSVRNSQLIVI